MNRLSKKMTRKSSEFELRKMHECKSSKKIRKEITNGGGCQRSLEPQLKTPDMALAELGSPHVVATEIDVIVQY